jgi:hypothetical protein
MPEPESEGPLLDPQGRPYFLWDMDMTLDRFRLLLDDPDPVVSGYFHAKLMRQARPEEVFCLTTARRIRELWPHLERHLGQSREFWTWIFEQWENDNRGWQ